MSRIRNWSYTWLAIAVTLWIVAIFLSFRWFDLIQIAKAFGIAVVGMIAALFTFSGIVTLPRRSRSASSSANIMRPDVVDHTGPGSDYSSERRRLQETYGRSEQRRRDAGIVAQNDAYSLADPKAADPDADSV